jgi:heme exporter protein B
MAILGFPVLIPLQLTILKLSKNAVDGLPWDKSYQEMLTLIALTLITAITSYLLFPYLWRD